MPVDPIFCSECGNPNEADAAFCESCGKPLDDAAPAVAAPAPAAPAAQTGRKVSSRMLAVVGVVILVGAGAVYLASRPASNLDVGGGSASDSAGIVDPDSFPAGDGVILIPSGPGSHSTISGGGAIARGAVLALRSSERICSGTNAVGDQFTAQLEQAVTGSNGARIPRGSTVSMVVDRASSTELVVSVQSIDLGDTTYLLSATVDAVEITRSDGLPPMPALPPGIPAGSVVTRAPGGGSGDRCIEPNAAIRVTLLEELRLGAP